MEIIYKQLESYSIPSDVTKIGKECFARCKELKQLNGTERIKAYEKDCFKGSPIKLNSKNQVTIFQELSKEQKNYLEEWTGLQWNAILFDSNVDDWSMKTSKFNERIMGKKQLVFIIQDEDGEIFGFYFNNQVNNKQSWTQSDTNSFYFNLQSNGRLPKPMKFKQRNLSCITIFSSGKETLFTFGDIHLSKENHKEKSYCTDVEFQSQSFGDYNGIKNALCGKSIFNGEGKYFFPIRIMVIQMK